MLQQISARNCLFHETAAINQPMPLRKHLILLIVLVPLCRSLHAQDQKTLAPSQHITTIPFEQLTGGVIILNAHFENYPDTLRFILDTGSSGISLDSSLVQFWGLQTEPSDRTIRGIGGVRGVSFLKNRKLHFPGLTVDSLDFHVNNYDILTAVYGVPIDGIIGYSFLSRYIVKIDYDSLKIDIYTIGSMEYPRGGHLIKPIMGTLPVHYAEIRDATTSNARFLHDVGAGLCLMLTSEFVKDSNLIQRKRILLTKEGEGLGGPIDMKVTVVKQLKIGPYKFKNVPTYIFDDDYNITSYPSMGGIIGNDIFRRFNSIINYSNKDIYIIPNKHFRDPFDYSYAGVELYFQDGKILLGDVAAGSPAEAAGLKESDEVVAINNNFTRNFNQLKAALQSASGKLKMIVRRNGELMQFEFKVKSIRQRKKITFR